jgi:hypothetical protein
VQEEEEEEGTGLHHIITMLHLYTVVLGEEEVRVYVPSPAEIIYPQAVVA